MCKVRLRYLSHFGMPEADGFVACVAVVAGGRTASQPVVEVAVSFGDVAEVAHRRHSGRTSSQESLGVAGVVERWIGGGWTRGLFRHARGVGP
jgi:hypothetical protein